MKNIAMKTGATSAPTNGLVTSARYPDEDRRRQMMKEACPMPDHDGLGDFDTGSDQQQPSEERHRDDGRCDSPGSGGNAQPAGRIEPKA